MKRIPFLLATICAYMCWLFIGCKSDYLEIKPNKRQVVPTTISDLQAMMDHATTLVTGHGLNMIGADEYYIEDQTWDLLPDAYQKNAYIWAKNVYENQTVNDWNTSYKKILYVNTALEVANRTNYSKDERLAWELAIGSAYFLRGTTFYQLAQAFCVPYRHTTADVDLGVPLRLEPDITLISERSSLQKTYEQIISDLEKAIVLLPNDQLVKQRPNKSAAYAMMAKTYLAMERYDKARLYADSCLARVAGLLDFNNIDTSAMYSFSNMRYGEGNGEVLYTSLGLTQTILIPGRYYVNPELFDSYSPSDLRSILFFSGHRGNHEFRGSYSGSHEFFTGLTVAEVLLIRAECNVRMGLLDKALSDLNELRENRYDKLTVAPFESNDSEIILREILSERRKELVFRGIRWEDLRRLNSDPRFATKIERKVNEVQYELKPNDKRYTWPIPDDVIRISNIQQNDR